jgi:hypothetical protein
VIELINKVVELAAEIGKASIIIEQKDKYIENLQAQIKEYEERLPDNSRLRPLEKG